MNLKKCTALALLGAASVAAACSSNGSSGTPAVTADSSSSSSGAPSAGSGGSSSGSSGAAVDGSSSSGSGGASSSGSSSGDVGATGVVCGGSLCAPPNSCCQAAGAAPICTVACAAGEQQLCTTDADCQANGTCVNGFCTGVTDAGLSDVYVPPLEGGVPPPGMGGTVPAGYPMPTAANVAMCQPTTTLVAGLCPGGGAGPVCIQCLFGGSTYNTSETTPTPQAIAEAGNYVVTVQLGGAAAGQTFISAESSRGLLAPTITKAGGSVEFAFVVNVRQMEGQPLHKGGPGGYPGLDLFFSGPSATPPQITGIGYALASAATKPVMVYIASDSTGCDQTGNVYGGWGQMLPQYLGPPVGIANYANSGANAGGFRGGFWAQIKAKWTAGDWVFIQFGHNDGGTSSAQFQTEIGAMVADAQAAGVTPLLVSPPARATFAGSVLSDQSSLHGADTKAVAAAKGVAFIDLTTLSTAWYNSLGQAAALKFHAVAATATGGTRVDTTHTNLAGADKLAGLITGAMKSQNIPLAKYLR